jgi:hypothetical protein
MSLDPVVLKARIDMRISQLRLLAAWTAANWRSHVESERPPSRDLPPPPRDDEPDEA